MILNLCLPLPRRHCLVPIFVVSPNPSSSNHIAEIVPIITEELTRVLDEIASPFSKPDEVGDVIAGVDEQSPNRVAILTDAVREQLERLQQGPELPTPFAISVPPPGKSAMSVEVHVVKSPTSLDASASSTLPRTSFFQKRNAGMLAMSVEKLLTSATGSATPAEKSKASDVLLDFVSVGVSSAEVEAILAKAAADVEAVPDTNVPVLTKSKEQQTGKKRKRKNKNYSLVVVPPPLHGHGTEHATSWSPEAQSPNPVIDRDTGVRNPTGYAGCEIDAEGCVHLQT